MTSETRAGKLPELPEPEVTFTNTALPSDYYTADQMRAYALEALAASEPVEAPTLPIDIYGKYFDVPIPVQLHIVNLREMVGHPINAVYRALDRFNETTQDDGSTDLPRDVLDALIAFGYLTKRRAGKHGFYYEMTDAGNDVLTTHPAPEQPGKGEAVAYLVEHDDGWQNVLLAGEVDDRFRDALTAAGRKVTPLGRLTPQPSDPAEGDAVLVERGLLGAACHAIANKKDAPTVLAKLREITLTPRAALSTPPAAAVSVDDAMVDRLSIALYGNCLPVNQAPARAALTAALDPQVKR